MEKHCTSIDQIPAVLIAETLAPGRGIVDLWYYFYEGMHDAKLLAAQEALMAPDERARYTRFHFERDRRQFLATRGLVRSVLSCYAAVAPADWHFAVGEHGKPRIGSPAVTPPIHFNLANTPGLVVCVVSVAHERVGVDAERIDREVESSGLADRYFSPAEVRAMRALPVFEQPRRFFAYWTLKESYLKARGLGLALPLDQFSFLINDTVSIAFDARLTDDALRWRFALIDAPPRHLIAVAVDTGGAALSLRATPVVPLVENQLQRGSARL
jgi:4'-phosphopantetheinyl transferase